MADYVVVNPSDAAVELTEAAVTVSRYSVALVTLADIAAVDEVVGAGLAILPSSEYQSRRGVARTARYGDYEDLT